MDFDTIRDGMTRMVREVTCSYGEKASDLQDRIGLVDDSAMHVRKLRLSWFEHVYRRDSDVRLLGI